MPASMFDDELNADRNRPDPGFKLGPCAMGPVGDGDKVTFMRVWVFQSTAHHRAAATGTSGERVGSQPERPPYKGRWMIRTELEPGSAVFTDDEPAMAVAMALVTHPDGRKGVVHWSQSVSIAT